MFYTFEITFKSSLEGFTDISKKYYFFGIFYLSLKRFTDIVSQALFTVYVRFNKIEFI